MTTIICDTRQNKKIWKDTHDFFIRCGHKTMSSKLPVGDYAKLNDLSIIVDTKRGFSEVCKNFCSQDRDRLKREILMAKEHEIELIFLIVHETATSIEDAKHWKNKRGKVTGETLFKTLDTFVKRYGVQFEFCREIDAGKKIKELLGVKDDYE